MVGETEKPAQEKKEMQPAKEAALGLKNQLKTTGCRWG